MLLQYLNQHSNSIHINYLALLNNAPSSTPVPNIRKSHFVQGLTTFQTILVPSTQGQVHETQTLVAL